MVFGKDRDEYTPDSDLRVADTRSGAPVSIIGSGMTITGNVTVDGTIRIEGRLEGNVTASQGVVMGPEAVVNGDIHAVDAIIGGRVRGAVETTGRLELHATCDVEGEITAPRFKMDEGGRVSGTVRIGRAADRSASQPVAKKRIEAAAASGG